jgi:Skp family chaperone for outer membrane proteins
MVRERVSTRGIVRPLESEHELSTFRLAPEDVGVISDLSIKRYMDGKKKYDKKFASTVKSIEKQRNKNYQLAKKEGVKSLSHLQEYLMKAEDERGQERSNEEKELSKSWNWAWALDDSERPPASSIASRRDTSEAINLAKIADLMSDGQFSGNNLWTHLVTFFTITPDKNGTKSRDKDEVDSDEREEAKPALTLTDDEGKSKNRFWKDKFKSKPVSKQQDDSPRSPEDLAPA